MRSKYDVVVIGGGHNGLVAGANLAKAGKDVLILEARRVLGGAAATEEVFAGYRFDTGASQASLLRAETLRALDLNIELLESPMSMLSLTGDKVLRLWRDPAAAQEEIARFSSSDASRYFDFQSWVENQASLLLDARDRIPPHLSASGLDRSFLSWARPALRLRRRGRAAVGEFLRTLPMSVEQMLDEWFEHPLLKGTLASAGIEGTMQGPKASGTGLMFLYQSASGFPPPALTTRGGMGSLASALSDLATEYGAEVRTGLRAEKILVRDYRVTGVALSDGQEVECRAVASSAAPGHTLLDLVGAPQLELRVVRRARNIRYRGSTAKVNLALDRMPEFRGVGEIEELTGRILFSPSTEYLERAYDDAKYGNWSKAPYLDMSVPTLLDGTRAPEGKHILSATVRYAPYRLDDGDWDSSREAFGDHVVSAISQLAPNLPQTVLYRQVITPLDYEREYGLPEGSIYHGQMAIDQLLMMRPLAGFGRYRSPVDGLYFCGAGAHPGGGVTGAPGRNAARVIVKDLRRSATRAP